MNKDNILDLLKKITYPGFSRDIVSFGMIKDIIIDNKTVSLHLNVKSSNEEKKNQLINEIKTLLLSETPFKEINIKMDEGSETSNSGSQVAAQQGPSTISGIKHIIAISSGKGGVGKSTVAVNLALSLRDLDLKVGLLDLDIYGPSLPVVLGINEQPDLDDNRKLIPLESLGMKVMSFGFISGNQSPTIWRGP